MTISHEVEYEIYSNIKGRLGVDLRRLFMGVDILKGKVRLRGK
jgi:hypothetical protein